jgi:hypothetical protein
MDRRGVGVCYAGIVEQNVQSAEGSDGLRYHGADLLLVGDVDRQCERPPPVLLDPRCRLFGRGQVDIGADDITARFGNRFGKFDTQPTTRSGNQRAVFRAREKTSGRPMDSTPTSAPATSGTVRTSG